MCSDEKTGNEKITDFTNTENKEGVTEIDEKKPEEIEEQKTEEDTKNKDTVTEGDDKKPEEAEEPKIEEDTKNKDGVTENEEEKTEEVPKKKRIRKRYCYRG